MKNFNVELKIHLQYDVNAEDQKSALEYLDERLEKVLRKVTNKQYSSDIKGAWLSDILEFKYQDIREETGW